MLTIIMHHRVVQRVDAFEVFSIQDMLRTDAMLSLRAEIGLEQLQHRTDDRQAGKVYLLALAFELSHQFWLQQREQHDTR